MAEPTDNAKNTTDKAPLLLPFRTWRLKVVTTTKATAVQGSLLAKATPNQKEFQQTEYLTFRTEGPPGIGALTGADSDAGSPGVKGVDVLRDLRTYVLQTLPQGDAAPAGEPEAPWWRRLDVAVDFSDVRVPTMYRQTRRDLCLQVLDSQGQVVRSSTGRPCGTQVWAPGDGSLAPSAAYDLQALGTGIGGQGASPAPPVPARLVASQLAVPQESACRLRVVPYLLYERFEPLGVGMTEVGPPIGWVSSAGALSGDELWTAMSFPQSNGTVHSEVHQSTSVGSGEDDATAAGDNGAVLAYSGHFPLSANSPDKPENWSDYRFSARLVAGDGGAVGLVFRVSDPGGPATKYYRFSMFQAAGVTRLEKFSNKSRIVIAEFRQGFTSEHEYRIAIEAVGRNIRVFVDDLQIIDAVDPSSTPLAAGSVGLYSWKNGACRFAEVVVEDLRAAATELVRVPFTTSQFGSFFHGAHSHNGTAWAVKLKDNALLEAALAKLGSQTDGASLPDMAETRQFDHVFDRANGGTLVAADQSLTALATRLETAWLQDPNGTFGLLVRLPFPMDWRRVTATLSSKAGGGFTATMPGAAKLISIADEWPGHAEVDVLLRQATSVEGWSLEKLVVGDPIEAGAQPTLMFAQRSNEAEAGCIHSGYSPLGALGLYESASGQAVSGSWEAKEGYILFQSPPNSDKIPDSKEGKWLKIASPDPTIILLRKGTFRDLRVAGKITPPSSGRAGLVFRFRDDKNYMLVTLDSSKQVIRLDDVAAGKASSLAEASWPDPGSAPVQFEILAFDTSVTLIVSGELLFTGAVTTAVSGRVGWFADKAEGAQFSDLEVETIGADPVIRPASPVPLESTYLAGAIGSLPTHVWPDIVSDGEVFAKVFILPGSTFGLVARYQDNTHHYRAIVHVPSTGVATVQLLRAHPEKAEVILASAKQLPWKGVGTISLRVQAQRLTVLVDGVVCIDQQDDNKTILQGSFGLVGCGEPFTAAFCLSAGVVDRQRTVGKWSIADLASATGPSRWHLAGGRLSQLATGGGGVTDPKKGAKSTSPSGSLATAGSSSWQDYSFSLTARSSAGFGFGLVVRYTDVQNYYLLSHGGSGGWHLRRCANGVSTVLATTWSEAGFEPCEDIRVRVEVFGARIRVWCGAQPLPILDASDDSLPFGAVGVFCSAGSSAEFRDVVVTKPSLDGIAKATKKTWSAGTSSSGMWLASGQWKDVAITARIKGSGSTVGGLVFRHTADQHLRFVVSPVGGTSCAVSLDFVKPGGSTALWMASIPLSKSFASLDQVLSAVVSGDSCAMYMNGIPVGTAKLPLLEAGAAGACSVGSVSAEFADIRIIDPADFASTTLLTDTFQYSVPARWSYIDTGKTLDKVQLAGCWKVASDKLTWSGTPQGQAQAAVAGSAAWADCRVAGQLRFGGLAPLDGVGIIARWTSEQDHIRLVAAQNSDGDVVWRLVSAVAGQAPKAVSEAEVATPLGSAGKVHLLVLDCVGPLVRAYVNGTFVGEVHTPLAKGKAGLWASGTGPLSFRSFQVTAAAWVPVHRFGAADTVPDGTTIRAVADGPVGWQGGKWTVRATQSLCGVASAPAVRLVDTSGAVVHANATSSPEVTKVCARFLRRRDGSAFILAAPKGQSLSAGRYALKFVYRRSGKGTDGSILPQQGVELDAGDEVVVLDIDLKA